MNEVCDFALWRLRMGGDISQVINNPEKYFAKLNDDTDRNTEQTAISDDWRRNSETLLSNIYAARERRTNAR